MPSKIHLTFQDGLFFLAEDPLVRLSAELKEVIGGMDEGKRYQSAIVKVAREEFDWNMGKTRKVLMAGEGKHWYRSNREGKDGRIFYTPVFSADKKGEVF